MKFYALLSFILFSIGLGGLCLKGRGLLAVLMSFQILFLSAGINFVGGACVWNNISGHVAAVVTLFVSIVEIVIGLALFVVYVKQGKELCVDEMTHLKDE